LTSGRGGAALTRPVYAMCIYRVRADHEDDFVALLRQHWPLLRDLGLAARESSVILRGEEDGGPFYIELLPWLNEEAPGTAHKYPEVMALWGPMEDLCEERAGRPAIEFPRVERVDLHAPPSSELN
jgi:hypothetical protein